MLNAFIRAADYVLTFPGRRPFASLSITAVVVAFAAVGVSRLRTDVSLQTMFPRGNPSADAMVRVMDAIPDYGELIVLASLPQQPGTTAAPPTDADVARLLDFAQRLKQGLEQTPDARGVVRSVTFAADPAYEAFARDVIAPAGLLYLDDERFAAARQRLTPDGIRQQIARNEAMASQPGPAASAVASQLLKDPLRLFEFVADRLVGRRPFETWQGGRDFVSKDGRAILIRIAGTKPPSDLDYCTQLMKAVTSAATSANTGQLQLQYTGAYAATDFSHHAIRHDSIISIVTSVVLLQLLFLVFYRRPIRQFLLEIVPVMVGIFIGFGLYGWFRGVLSPIAAVVGGILAGLAVDYSVLHLANYFRYLREGYSPLRSLILTATQAVPAMFAAFVTSSIGFVAIAWSSVRTLRDFAVLGTLGLASAFAAVTLILPAVLVLYDTRRLARSDTLAARQLPFRFNIEGLLKLIFERRRILLGASVSLFVVAAVLAITRPGGPIALEPDLHVMHPQPNPALSAEKELSDRFGFTPSTLIVHLKADSPERLVELSHEVDRRLSTPQAAAAGIRGTAGLSSLLPDPVVAERRRTAFSPTEVQSVVSEFHQAIEASIFDPERYKSYEDFLRMALSAQVVPSVQDVLGYPALARSLLPEAALAATGPATSRPLPTESINLVFVTGQLDDRDQRERTVAAARFALAGLNGATLTGLPVISLDTESAVVRDLPRLLSIAMGLVVVYLLLHYRSLSRALLALLPVFFSFVVLAGAARLLNLRLNLINLIALPMLVGIDVDYGIYLVSLAARRRGQTEIDNRPLADRVAASVQAITVCASAGILGFGSLSTVSVPAIQSLGLAVAIGIASCVVGTFCLLAPLLMMLEERQVRTEHRAEPKP